MTNMIQVKSNFSDVYLKEVSLELNRTKKWSEFEKFTF